jgi:DNA-binding Lrp family transcriptional regulator
MTTPTLDTLDRRILDLWQRDTRQSGERIGAQVGLSAAAVQRRLLRLRETGVITAETAQLDCASLGLDFTAIVNVDLIDESARAQRAFTDKACARPEVQQCYGIAGAYDIVLVVVVPDLPAYDAFCEACMLHDPNVRSFSTQVVLYAVRRNGPLALGERDAAPR